MARTPSRPTGCRSRPRSSSTRRRRRRVSAAPRHSRAVGDRHAPAAVSETRSPASDALRALAAIATVVFTAALGTRLIGRSRALVAAGVVATTPMMLVFGRLAIFDVPLTAFITAALYCLVRARLDGAPMRWWPAAGLAMGLAVLTKGPVGVAVP